MNQLNTLSFGKFDNDQYSSLIVIPLSLSLSHTHAPTLNKMLSFIFESSPTQHSYFFLETYKTYMTFLVTLAKIHSSVFVNERR